MRQFQALLLSSRSIHHRLRLSLARRDLMAFALAIMAMLACAGHGGRGDAAPATPSRSLGHVPVRDVQLRSEEHTSELQSPCNLVCRLLLEKKKKNKYDSYNPYKCN